MNERSIFLDALELTDPDDRRKYLDQACGVDQELRGQVEELLVSHNDASSFLEKPPEGLVATIAGVHETVGESLGDDSLEFLDPTDKPGCLGTLSQYEVVEVVGRGGMGIVLRAYDTKLNRVVAIKVMALELAANAMAVKRFLREARAAAAVSHDHVVTIHAIEEDNRPPFIVMEFVDGQSLQEKIGRDGALELNEILRIGLQMARGLEAAHEQGLVHRDIKPANILLENGVERVKITDFGLARAVDDVSVTQTGQIAGTPQFMSPEQAQGHAIDARSDLFSMGSVLYTMCAGRPPFRADSAVAMLRRVTDDDPRPVCEVNSDIPDWMEAITFKLLAKDPAERFQSAAEVADLLSQHLAHLQHPTTAPRPPRIAPPKPASPLREQKPIADQFRGSTWRRRLWPAMGIAALMLVFGYLLLGAIIHVVTDRGELILEVDDPQIQVQITQDGREVKILKEGDYRITMLRSGQYNIEVLGESSDSFEISHERLSISRGIKKVVTIRRKPSPEGVRPVEQITEVRRLEGHTDIVGALGFTPDGKSLVSGSQDVLYHWDLATDRVVREIPVDSPVKALVALPDNQHVITSHEQHDITMWNLANGLAVRQFIGHTSKVHRIAISSDGKRLLSGGDDGLVRLWDVGSGKQIRSFKEPVCTALAFSHDGRFAAHGGTSLVVQDLESGDTIQTMKREGGSINAVAFSPDGRFVLAGDYYGVIEIWQVATGKQMGRLNAHNAAIKSLLYTPDGRYFVSSSFDQTILLFDTITVRQASVLRRASNGFDTTMKVVPSIHHSGERVREGVFIWLLH